MKALLRLCAILAVGSLVSCGSGETSPGNNGSSSGDAPGFVQLHREIIANSCNADACHGGERGIAGLAMTDPETAYDSLVGITPVNGAAVNAGMKRVDPENPENSFLLQKIARDPGELVDAGFGAPMPLTGDRLGEKSLEAFRQWIEAGAPYEGASFEADFAGPDDEDAYVDCDATDEQGMRDCFGAAPDPEKVVRIYSPPIEVPANREVIICSYLDYETTDDLIITETRGRQMSGGHHAAIFVASNPSDDHAPHECTDAEMTNFQFVAGAGGGGGQDTSMPEGRALRVRKGWQLVIQSHYINTTDEPQMVMDAVDLEVAPSADGLEIVDPFAMISSQFEIPAGAQHEVVEECTVNKTRNIYMLLGHTHDYGTLFEFEIQRDGEAEAELLYHATDGPLLRDSPEIKMYDPPLTVNPGDILRMRCEWDNTTDEALAWPEEMCVALMYYGPGEGWLTCSNGEGKPSVGTGEGCASITDAGNELGVGEYCTPDGNECADNSEANFCLAPFNSSANYCSKISCQTDEECGSGASCVEKTQGSACVPDKCA